MSNPTDSADAPTWEEAAAQGSIDELHAWGRDNYHVDLTDPDVVLSLAANAVCRGAWRNNSELEDIHAGAYNRPGQKAPRGLSDPEMMIGNIETTKILRKHLATGGQWWYLEAEDDLFDFDRPYAGTPLTDHVTKKVLAQHRKQVKNNLWLFRCVEQVVGWDRFLLGLALTSLDEVHWGSPLWPTQVDAWADQDDTTPTPQLVEALKADPSQIPVHDIRTATNTGIGYAQGRERWHIQHCGNANHFISRDLADFIGMYGSLMGLPQMWLYATVKQRESR